MTPDGQLLTLSLLLRGLTLRLYRRIDAGTGAYDEADFPGYSPAELSDGLWNITRENDTVSGNHPQVEFTCNVGGAAHAIGGYYLTRGTTVLDAAAFEMPAVVQNAGDAIKVTPRVVMESV